MPSLSLQNNFKNRSKKNNLKLVKKLKAAMIM